MCLTQGLHRSVQQHPDSIAVRWSDKTRIFGAFADCVSRFAGALQKLDVQPGYREAMLSLNSERYLDYPLAMVWAIAGKMLKTNLREPSSKGRERVIA